VSGVKTGRRGRRASDGATDVVRISLCMTPHNRDELQRLADADGISASAMVRKLVSAEISLRQGVRSHR
jgi:hypothetical protein